MHPKSAQLINIKESSEHMKPVVSSLLETDLYKFTMWQALLHSHPEAQASYSFHCRSSTLFPLADLVDEVNMELDHLCALRFREDELEYLRGLRFIKSDFVDFLTIFQFQRKFIHARAEGDKLVIEAHGPQVHVMGFEIFVLYIVNELYFRKFDQEKCYAEALLRLETKTALLKQGLSQKTTTHPFVFSDFGLRRRFSGELHEKILSILIQELPSSFKGTSNVYLAKKLNILPIGTMAHEYLQSYQAFGVRLRDFQKAALDGWVREFRGELGTALTDVVGIDAFLNDFDRYFGLLYDGLRVDSGDPIEVGEKIIRHYEKLRINPHTKRIVFSDSLNFEKALALHFHFADRIIPAFGIGTNLTNDTGIPAINIVMKLVSCNGQPVAKISDTPGKTANVDMGFLRYLSQVFDKPIN